MAREYELDNPFLRIKPGFIPPEGHQTSYDHYISSIQRLLGQIIPSNIIPMPSELKVGESIEPYFKRLESELPIIKASKFDDAPTSISIALFCASNHTQGIGRYICDLFTLWLIPGKQLPGVNMRSFNVQFLAYPKQRFFINEIVIEVLDNRDISFIRHNLPKLIEDLRINLLAVAHARHVVTIKPLTHSQKKILIQENIAALFQRYNRAMNSNIFEQVQDLLLKASGERNTAQIKDQIVPLLEMRPEALNREMYKEMQHFVLNLHDSFTQTRELRHINRVVSYHYIFRKIVMNSIENDPSKRHISTKILRTRLHEPEDSYPVCGLLVALNFLSENEIFEQRHLLSAINSCIPNVELVPGSCMVDLRPSKHVRTIYLEFKHSDKRSFTSEEIRNLRTFLEREIMSQTESVINPIFVHRNEEEIMRNILDLAKELKYPHDIPQVMINFHKQTSTDLSFIVILLRLLKSDDDTLNHRLRGKKLQFTIEDHESKLVGVMRKKHPKEANILEINLSKKQFLRKDYSLDLYKARLIVFNELTKVVGEMRDYNGGIISKQFEVLTATKRLLEQANIKNDFLLENYFYCIFPTYMQSLLKPEALAGHFQMLLKLVENDFSANHCYMSSESIDQHFLIFVVSCDDAITEELVTAYEASPSENDLSIASLAVYDLTCVGVIAQYASESEKSHLLNLTQAVLAKKGSPSLATI